MIGARGGGRLSAALVLAAIGLAPACGREPLVVATIAAPDAGPVPCTIEAVDGSADASEATGEACPAGELCEAASCGATTGTCQPVPATCDDPAAFECGCDGVTYFNDCVRRAAGVSLASRDECVAGAKFCGTNGSADCPTSPSTTAVCAFVVPAALAMAAPMAVSSLCPALQSLATCWGLPRNAPASTTTRLRPLGPSTAASPMSKCPEGSCEDAFSALQDGNGKAFVEATDCP